MNPRFSIIIPHKDVPQLLQRCLDSIPVRDDVEVIVVDDNSSPDRVDFEHFPTRTDIAVRHFFPKEGRGAGYARNIGLDHARGEWVLFADADDYYITDALNELLNAMGKRSTYPIVFPIIEINNDSTIRWKIDCAPNQYLVRYGSPWISIFPIQLLQEKNIRFEEIPYANDIMFTTRVAVECNPIQVYDKPVYIYERRENSLTTTPDIENYIVRFKVSLRQEKYLKRNHFKRISHSSMFLDVIAYRDYNLFLRCLLKVAISGVFSLCEFRQFYLAICKEAGISKYPFKSVIVNRRNAIKRWKN